MWYVIEEQLRHPPNINEMFFLLVEALIDLDSYSYSIFVYNQLFPKNQKLELYDLKLWDKICLMLDPSRIIYIV